MKNTIKAVIAGHNCDGDSFCEEVRFNLAETAEKEKCYGTGCYIEMVFPTGKRIWYDMRYARTTDIVILARECIGDYYGKNAEQIHFEEVTE